MHLSPVHVHWPLSGLEHGAFVLAGLLIYLTATRLSREHRHPSAALAWVLIMSLLPYVGIPLFLLFGVRKVPRPHARLRQADRQQPCEAGHWARDLGQGLALPSATCDNQVDFHPDGQAALDALLALLKQARHRIDICTFILGKDEVATALSSALIQAAERGVRVRLMLDELGCWSTPRSLVRHMREAGVSVQFFMPLLPNIRRGRVNLRNHRKLVIIDGEHVWSGGRNLAAAYFVRQGQTPAWNDISFVISGPMAQQAHDLYQQDWLVASGEVSFVDTPVCAPSTQSEDGMMQWIPSGPDHADDTLHALLLAAAYRAEKHIVLVSPYFVPDDALLSAWCMACRRGVQLTLVLPARSNHALADVARAPSMRALMAAGAQVMLYPRMLHAKAIIVDQDIAWCGSANLDARSLFLNFELNTAFYDAQSIAWLTQWALRLANESQAASSQPPSAAKEMLEGLVRIVGFQL